MNKCGCEYDERCTKVTVCHMQSVLEDAQDPLQDFKDDVLTYALDYVNECKHGRDISKANKNLWEAVERYEMEVGDGE